MVADKKRTILTAVWGNELPSTQFAGRPSGGMSVRGAMTAGVIKDVPAPKEWLQLASELPNAPQAAAKKSPRDKLIQKYKIADGCATITPDEFHGLLNQTEGLRKLKEIGVTDIAISDGASLHIQFHLLTAESEIAAAAALPARATNTHLKKNGISSAFASHADILVTNYVGTPLGILTAISFEPALVAFSRGTKGETHKISNTAFKSNFHKVFQGSASLTAHMKAYEGKTHLPITFHFYDIQSEKEPFIIADSFHPNDQPSLSSSYNSLSVSRFKRLVSRAFSQSETPTDLIHHIFQGQSSITIIACRKALAILTPPQISPRLPE